MRTRIHLLLAIAAVCLFAGPLFAQNHKIDFEDFAGPARFDTAQPPARANPPPSPAAKPCATPRSAARCALPSTPRRTSAPDAARKFPFNSINASPTSRSPI